MTRDKAQKTAARQRMAETGEPYSVARRAVAAEPARAEGPVVTGMTPEEQYAREAEAAGVSAAEIRAQEAAFRAQESADQAEERAGLAHEGSGLIDHLRHWRPDLTRARSDDFPAPPPVPPLPPLPPLPPGPPRLPRPPRPPR